MLVEENELLTILNYHYVFNSMTHNLFHLCLYGQYLIIYCKELKILAQYYYLSGGR